MLNRRETLIALGNVGMAALGAPFMSRRRHRLFAASQKQYSTHAIDLVQRATVIDMLSPLTLDLRAATASATRSISRGSITRSACSI